MLSALFLFSEIYYSKRPKCCSKVGCFPFALKMDNSYNVDVRCACKFGFEVLLQE